MSGPPTFNRVNGAMLLPSRSGNSAGNANSQSILSSLLVNSNRTSGLIQSGLSTAVYPASSQLGAAAASFQQQQQINNQQQSFQHQLQSQHPQQFQLNHHGAFGGVNSSVHSRMPFHDFVPSVSSSSNQSTSIQQQQHLVLQPVSSAITVHQPKPRLPIVVQQHQQLQQQQLPSLSVIASGGNSGGGFRPPPSLVIDDARQQQSQSTPPPSLSLVSLTPPQTVDNGVQCGPSLDPAVPNLPAPLPPSNQEDCKSMRPAGMVAFRLSMSRRRNIADSIVEFERSKTSDGILSGRVDKARVSSVCVSSSSALPASTSVKKRKNLANSLLIRAGAELHLDSQQAIRLVHGCLQRRIRADIDSLLAGYFDSYVQPCLSNIRSCECQDDEQTEYQQQHKASFYRAVAEDLAAQFANSATTHQALQGQQQGESFGNSNSPFSAYRLDGESHSLLAGANSDRASVGPDTSFVVGSCVNRCLGLVSRGCQRVYDRHRHLYRYLCDAEDKRYLVERAHLSSSSGARTYLLLLDEVLQLLELPEYRSVSQRSIDRLKSSAFLLPVWFSRKVLPLATASAAASGAASASAAVASPANSSLVGGISEPVSPCSVTGVGSLSAPNSP
ncbi:hypothetical protein BOX15_Mlig031253g1 [Macrostomum lignano]|uniref:TdIF1 C-terminal domain-containing protein n=1 Tax=Macrostomum lignano TaxID=282301 RepID=A0A267DX75_9PLAT|nr:hypothetical protein BOX15_Mlig031253g1 [Macrostomum lignano]